MHRLVCRECADEHRGDSPDFGVVVNRHPHVNPGFRNRWFAVTKPGGEAQAMGRYLPRVINMRHKARFEALGCLVETGRLAAMAGR